MLEKTHIEISTGTILRTLLVILGVWFLYLIRDIIALLFIAAMLLLVLALLIFLREIFIATAYLRIGSR